MDIESFRSFSVFDNVCSLHGVVSVSSPDLLKHNAILKFYDDGSCNILCCNRSIFRESGFESRSRPFDDQRSRCSSKAENLSRSRRRARSAAFDIARSSDFDLFVTLTVDKEKADRYNPDEVFHYLHNWLDNSVRRHGLRYLLVPEFHKDGALHFHALFNDCFEKVDSGTVSINGRPRKPRSKRQREEWLQLGGHVVYNLPSWGLGYSTAIWLYGDLDSAAGYVVKYITKSDKKIGGRWYYSGGELRRPYSVCADIPFDNVMYVCEPFRISSLNCDIVRFNVGKDDLQDVLEALAVR